MGLKSVLPMRLMGWSETIKICKLEGPTQKRPLRFDTRFIAPGRPSWAVFG